MILADTSVEDARFRTRDDSLHPVAGALGIVLPEGG